MRLMSYRIGGRLRCVLSYSSIPPAAELKDSWYTDYYIAGHDMPFTLTISYLRPRMHSVEVARHSSPEHQRSSPHVRIVCR